VQLIKLEASGAMHIAEHIMERAVRLDRLRRVLTPDDNPALEMELADIFGTALFQAKALQRQYRTGW
jgi:hypothetical protein